MSLVIALRLRDGSILFAADKRIATKSTDLAIVNQSSHGKKLFSTHGGVFGIVGNPDFARDILTDIRPVAGVDKITDLCATLEQQFALKTRGMPESVVAEKETELLFSDGSERYVRFSSVNGFSVPDVSYGEFEASGETLYARLIYGLFATDDGLSLQAAKRLAALQIGITADIDPSSVSQEIDMLLLDNGTVREIEDVSAAREWAAEYRKSIRARLHAAP